MNLRRGRPSKYLPSVHPAFAAYLASDGLTEEEIAARLSISKTTLTTWKGLFPAFRSALSMSKEGADAAVVMSLYQKAVQGDVTACRYWLGNRQPTNWKEPSQRLDVSAKVAATKIDMSGLSELDLQIALSLVDKIKHEGDDDGDIGALSPK